MKFVYFLFSGLILFSLIWSASSGGRATAFGAGNSGAPCESGIVCANCHSGGAYGTTSLNLTVVDPTSGNPVSSYTPGVTYDVTLTVIPGQGTPNGYGCQFTAVKTSNSQAGTFQNPGTDTQIATAGTSCSSRDYVEHTQAAPSPDFRVEWVAPAAGTGDVTFYYVGNCVNTAQGNQGDNGSVSFSTVFAEECSLQINCPFTNEVPLSCLDQIPVADTTLIAIVAACGNITITAADIQTPTTGCISDPIIVTRTYTVTDEKDPADPLDDVSVDCVQVFEVEDLIPPVWNEAPGQFDIYFLCHDELIVPAPPTTSDNCSFNNIVAIISDITDSQSCTNHYTRTLIYEATDDCGNISVPYIVTLTVDDIPPFWDLPPGVLDVTYDCAEDVTEPFDPTATDNCSGITTVVIVDDVTIPDFCTNKYFRVLTYQANDDCGNTSGPYTITITVDDNIAPVWDQLPGALDFFFQCDADLVIPVPSTATDNCFGITTVVIDDVTIPDFCTNKYFRVLTYQANDDCGNTSTYVVTITVDDQTSPAWDQAPDALDVTYNCLEDFTEPASPTATDNCANNNVVIMLESADQISQNPLITVYNYTATDECGNTSTYPITITVDPPYCCSSDTDSDGLCNNNDPDDDNDGIPDLTDLDPLNPFICGDLDLDGCEDCTQGVDGLGPLPDSDPNNDGPDFDGDGICDSSDTDDDNDGVVDAKDTEPFNANIQ